MKRILLSGLLMLLNLLNAFSQISIQPVLPVTGLIQTEGLWNAIVINNSSESIECRLEISLRDRLSGMEVLAGVSGSFNVSAGVKRIDVSQIMPVQYNMISSEFSGGINDLIPIGNYVACYRLTGGKNAAANECVALDVKPLSPPALISPADSAKLPIAPAQFVWLPPAPINLFKDLQYDLLITEISEGKDAQESLVQDPPFYSENNVSINNITYAGTNNSFEKGKWYAWQVTARDGEKYAGKSEAFVFTLTDNSIALMLISQSPYLKMRKELPEKGIAPNSILKISYINETGDSTMLLKITDLNKSNKTLAEWPFVLKQGENLFQIDLSKKINTKDSNLLEASFVNTRKEQWKVQFEIRQFEATN